jgi:spermidine/putrescine transport system substrate-binding protein
MSSIDSTASLVSEVLMLSLLTAAPGGTADGSVGAPHHTRAGQGPHRPVADAERLLQDGRVRPFPDPLLDRRTLLRLGLRAGAGVAAAGVLAACGRGDRPSTAATGATTLDPDRATVWPIVGEPIPDGLAPERGATLRVYQWREYLYDDVLESFVRRHADRDIDVEVESFTTMSEAVARLRRPGSDFDVFFPTIDALPGLIGSGMVRPLTGSYLPNVANLWPWFRGADRPFYDAGGRYTVPYTVYSSGVAWDLDRVRDTDAPPTTSFEVLWNPRYRGSTAFYDHYREALGLALLRAGADPVDADARQVAAGGDALVEAVGDLGAKLDTDAAYREVPTGRLAAAQAWSGDVISAVRHGRGGAHGAERLAYWWPMTGGVVGCDLTAVLTQGRNPVLAHAFLDHLLDERVAIANYSWNGYQPPIDGLDRRTLSAAGSPWNGLLPDHLLHCGVMTERELEQGRFLLTLPPQADAAWLRAWQRVQAAEA